MAYEYTTVTVDLTEGGPSGASGTIYAELFHAVTLANNDTVAPQVYSASVVSGAASLVLPCTATAIMNTNAPFLVTFIPTGGKRRTLGRIITTESATAVQLSDLLEVGGSSAVPVTTYNVEATNLVTSPSIAHLQAIRDQADNARVLVQDTGIYRYDADSTTTADESTVVTPASAVGRWLLEIADGDGLATYDIRHYGATTGAANNATYISDAIAAAYAAGGGTVYIPPGTWTCTTQITLLDKVQLVGDGRGSHLDFSNAGAITDCIKGAGSVAATSVAFSSNITKGDTTITFPSAPTGVAAGSLLLIYDSADSGFNAARTYYRRGEWCKVKGVSGGTVSLADPVYDSYTTGSTRTIYLVTPVTAGVRNLRCTFKAGLSGIVFQYGNRCVAEGLDLTGSNLNQVFLDRCYESVIRGVNAFDASAATGENYGAVIGNSQRILVTGCNLDATRHGLAIGGGDTVGSVPNREILVTGNTINGHTAALAGADCHGNCENVTYQGNQLLAGLNLGGDSINVLDNVIRTTSTTSRFGIYGSELLGPNVVIRGNTIVATGALTSANSAAINFSKNSSAWTTTTRSGTLVIKGNDIDMQSYEGDAIVVKNTSVAPATATIEVDISENTVHGTSAGTNRFGVYVIGDSTNGFKTISIRNNHLANATIRVEKGGARTTFIAGNVITSAALEGIRVTPNTSYHATYNAEEETYIVEDNRIIRPNKTGIYITGSDTGALTFVFVRGNTAVSCAMAGTTGSSTTDGSLHVATAAVATVERNVFGKMPNDATGSQIRYIAFNGVTTVFERDNVNVGTVVTNSIASVTNRHLDTFFPFNFSGVPGAAVIYTHVITRRCTIPATAPSSYAKAGTAATAATTFDIAVNGVAKGTFLWAIAGTVAAFTVASDVVLAPGDILTITTENPADGTLANIGGALAAYTY